MRARLPLLLLFAATAPAVAQDFPPERLFPLGTGDRWLYAVVESRGSIDPTSVSATIGFEDIEVVGDTVLGSTTWKLVYKYVLDADGTLLETTRYAQIHDSNGHNYVTHELDCTNTCYIGFSNLPYETWPAEVEIGSIGYIVEGEGVNMSGGAGLKDGGGFDGYESFATDIGLHHVIFDLRLPDRSFHITVKRLTYAEVGGVVYGVYPLAAEDPPPVSGRLNSPWRSCPTPLVGS